MDGLNLQQTNTLSKIIDAVEAGRTASIDTQFGEVHVRRSRFFCCDKKYVAELVRGEWDAVAHCYAGSVAAAVFGLGDKLRAAETAKEETAEEFYARLVRNAKIPNFIEIAGGAK